MRKTISVFCGIVALFTVAAVASAQATDAAARGDAFPRPLMIVGRIVPARQAAAAWSVEGRIVEVNVEEGDRAKKGEILARVDARPYEFKLVVAQANYGAVRAEPWRHCRKERRPVSCVPWRLSYPRLGLALTSPKPRLSA